MRELSPYLLERPIPPPSVDFAARSINPSIEDGPEIGFLDYWRTIRKHARLIGAVTLALVLLTGLVVLVETPEYTATTTVLIERNAPQVLNIRYDYSGVFSGRT